ncbi:MAG: hypothetical protein H0V09_07940 [Gemmatimonadetes bacterium]|nr:hypothetical protein [Gemmatimonadota bacterium]
MLEDVQVLLQLQEIDAELRDLRSRSAAIPVRRAELQRDERQLLTEAEGVRERLKGLVLEERARESEISAQEDRARRYQGQLESVTTNREYSTLLSEIKGVKEKVSAAEDRALVIIDESERLRTRTTELEGEIQRAREASQEERAQLDGQEREIGEEIAVRTDRRQILAGRVGGELLRAYETIVRRNRLPAVFPLRGRACGNCFGTLPLQAASEIRRQDRPYTCEHCGVILYVPEPEGSAV